MGFSFAFLGLIFLNILLACVAQYNYTLKNTNFTRHCVTKNMLTVNDAFPGPEITVEKAENETVTVNVTVHNEGNYGVTLHWHGVRQPRNPWHDGPEYVTQCPIKPNTTFTQQITFSEEIGTLWWHAHSDWSRATLHGAIIIKPPNGTYPFDPQPDGGEQTIVLASWYDTDDMAEFYVADNYGEPNVSDAYTINGYIGNYTSTCSNETTFTMSVESGKTYLLRIINAVMNEEMFFSIANHSLRVVGMDGAYIAPIDTDYILIPPGNTMDVLVTANLSTGSYYMAASNYKNGGASVSTNATTAIFKYETPSTPVYPTDTLPGNDNVTAAEAFLSSIKSSTNQSVPTENITRFYSTGAVFANQTSGTRFASLSNITFVLPNTNYLLNSSLSCVTEGNCSNLDAFPMYPQSTGTLTNASNVIVVNHNDVVEIVFQGLENGAEDHPMHLHGHSFFLLGRAFNKTFDNETDPQSYNLVDPPLLNTVSLPYQGWVTIRFVADNPGVWFIHCHLERHTNWGMATALIVKDGTNTKVLPRPDDMPSCS